MSEEEKCKECGNKEIYQDNLCFKCFGKQLFSGLGEKSKEQQLQEENKRLNNIINELEKCIKDKYYEAVDYQTKIRQSDLMQGDYPVSYYLSEQDEQLCNYFLNRLKDLQELKGSDKE